jgi:two-component system, cell cycle sensor histidine kinase and response regulator CckA
MKKLRVLNIEDSEDDSFFLLRHLKGCGYQVEWERVDSIEGIKAALAEREWDILISDFQMPGLNGLIALEVLKESGLDLPFIVISGTIGEDIAIQAMIAGVNDYLMKDNLGRLAPAIERELQEAANRKARREAEKNLLKSEKRLQLALSAGGLGVWEWNLQTDRVYWSPECFEITRVTNFDNTFQSFKGLLHPEDAEFFMASLQDSIDHKKSCVAEFRLITTQGEILWLASSWQTEYDQDETPLRLIGTVKDITEQKQSEAAIRESEEKFRALVEATTQYVWTAGPQLKIDELPKWWTGLTGQPTEEVGKWGWLEVLHPEDREIAKENWKMAVLQKRSFHIDLRIFVKKGEYRYFAVRGVPIFTPEGSVSRWIGAMYDFTERKRSIEDLQQSEQRFRSLVSATAQIVWTADPNGVILTAHTPYGESLKDAGKAIGEGWIFQIHPDDKERVLAEFSAAIQSKTHYRCEYRMLHTDNQYHYFIARGMPVFEKNSDVREWIGTLTDITESKLAEAELLKKEEQLRQAQKLESIGRLAGGIAHDFNNMLTVINGYSDLVIRSLSIDNPIRRKIEEIRMAGKRSAEITNRLLAFSRRQILKNKVIDLNQLVSDTDIILDRLIGEDIQIVEDLCPNLSQIEADSGQLSQIIMNLVINSRDAMPHGGIITIKTENVTLDEEFVNQNMGASVGNFILLKISDTGFGMDEETISHIFEPFFTTKEVGQGTGLGLSTVYGIVTQFGGYLTVSSNPGQGTTFNIYLPSLKDPVKNSEKQLILKDSSYGTETILLVEDEELVRKLSRQMLEKAGYKVIEAENGDKALSLMEQINNKIDLLITDVVMPKMSGRELANHLAEVCPRVLFISGYTDDDMMKHGISNVNFNFLQKPYTLDEFTRKVREVLDNSS